LSEILGCLCFLLFSERQVQEVLDKLQQIKKRTTLVRY
jgi:hypothetical protein